MKTAMTESPLLGPTRKERRLRRLPVYRHQGVSLASLWQGGGLFLYLFIARPRAAFSRTHPYVMSATLLYEPKGNGAKAHSSGGDKPPLRRKQRYHTALPSQPMLIPHRHSCLCDSPGIQRYRASSTMRTPYIYQYDFR